MKRVKSASPQWLNRLYDGWSVTGTDGVLIEEVRSLLQEELRCSSGEAEFLIHQALASFRRGR